MPFFVGISVTGLSAGSPISVQLVSSEDDTYTHSFQGKILDPSDLTPTFEQIASSIPEDFEDASLSFPSFLAEEERQAILKAVKAVPAFSRITKTVASENLKMVRNSLNEVPYPPQNELELEIGPDAATLRLISTEVEEGIRTTDIEKEIIIRDLGSKDLVTQLVNPALAALAEDTSQSDSNFKNVGVVEDPSLKRVVIVDSSPDVVASLLEQLKIKFQEMSPPVEIIVKTNLAKYVADLTLGRYVSWNSILEGNGCIFNVAPLSVGIVKADGFVLTVIKRYSTLPQQRSVILTTSKDLQTTATIKVVVGASPKPADNTLIAELVLKGLTTLPKGRSRVKVSFELDFLGKTHIVAEEILEEGAAAGSRTSVELKGVTGDTMTTEELVATLERINKEEEPYSEEVEESENRWAGEEAQGDLP